MLLLYLCLFFRFQDDLESSTLPTINGGGVTKIIYNIDGTQIPESSSKRTKVSGKSGRSLRAKVLSRVFSEDYERVQRKILDPRGQAIRRWNKIFLVACLVSLFVDPLFFYLPVVRDVVCIDIGVGLEVILTTIRSIADVFYTIQIFIKFRTAFVAPSSRVFGRGELVIDPCKIAMRYLRHGFWIDFIAALPIPQVYAGLTIVFQFIYSDMRLPIRWSKDRDFHFSSCRYWSGLSSPTLVVQQWQTPRTSLGSFSYSSTSQDFFSYFHSQHKLLRPLDLWHKQHGLELLITWFFICWQAM